MRRDPLPSPTATTSRPRQRQRHQEVQANVHGLGGGVVRIEADGGRALPDGDDGHLETRQGASAESRPHVGGEGGRASRAAAARQHREAIRPLIVQLILERVLTCSRPSSDISEREAHRGRLRTAPPPLPATAPRGVLHHVVPNRLAAASTNFISPITGARSTTATASAPSPPPPPRGGSCSARHGRRRLGGRAPQARHRRAQKALRGAQQAHPIAGVPCCQPRGRMRREEGPAGRLLGAAQAGGLRRERTRHRPRGERAEGAAQRHGAGAKTVLKEEKEEEKEGEEEEEKVQDGQEEQEEEEQEGDEEVETLE
ncbi:unnamed protein product [Prorocentrum cordatum]|uniref:Uncharacterized protein n=1 Tax=Prorocentrum cordatum TaxID=2364126 RepID=A0ABN9U771_9DINO|nr:unnamed protein product [Polarella glacialis]